MRRHAPHSTQTAVPHDSGSQPEQCAHEFDDSIDPVRGCDGLCEEDPDAVERGVDGDGRQRGQLRTDDLRSVG